MPTPLPQLAKCPQLGRFLALPAVATLVAPGADCSLAELVPGIEAEIMAAFPAGSPHARGVLLAALWLRAGDLDTGHRICQDIPTPQGSAWHAVMHRREGDFWNSKYWWRQARSLAWPGALAAEVAGLAHGLAGAQALARAAVVGRYDPAAFVDAVEAIHATGHRQALSILQRVQELEWSALFEQCLDAAK